MPPRSRKAARSTDPQKERLYEWENNWRDWNVNNLPLQLCRAIIRDACKAFRVPAPRVTQHKGISLSWYSAGKISLQADGLKAPEAPYTKRPKTTGGKNRAVCLHEAAHYIAEHFFGTRIQDHGPTFLGIYMWLLDEWRIAPTRALHSSARAFGLRWRPGLNPVKCRR